MDYFYTVNETLKIVYVVVPEDHPFKKRRKSFQLSCVNIGRAGLFPEISREFNLSKKVPIAAHVEYNGGLNRHSSFQQAALVGAAWNGHSADFSKTYSVQLMYKHYFKSYEYTRSYPSFQLTGVWGLNFAKGKGTFSGFIDFWRGEKANGHGQLVILSEPQLWYNATSHFSVGTEVEVSNNFVYNTYNDKTFFINPTLGVKWNF